MKTKVVITNNPAGIATAKGEDANTQNIYSVSGVRMSKQLNSLPKGVYIVNGRKVVKSL